MPLTRKLVPMFTSPNTPRPPSSVNAPVVELVELVSLVMRKSPPNVELPDRPMPP